MSPPPPPPLLSSLFLSFSLDSYQDSIHHHCSNESLAPPTTIATTATTTHHEPPPAQVRRCSVLTMHPMPPTCTSPVGSDHEEGMTLYFFHSTHMYYNSCVEWLSIPLIQVT